MKKDSQNKVVLSYLEQHRTLTTLEAIEKWKLLRLGARINDLKKLGHNIHSQMVSVNGKRIAVYSL